MSIRDLIHEALRSLEANRGRSLLTILGIVIGIASVIAMTSLIGGIQDGLIGSLGLNAARTVNINTPTELTDRQIERLEKTTPELESLGNIDQYYTEHKKGDKSYSLVLTGIDAEMLAAKGYDKLVCGRTYTDSECESGAKVTLIDRAGARILFGDDENEALGRTLTVNGRDLAVIGVVDTNDGDASGFSAIMPRATAKIAAGSDATGFTSATALAQEGTDMDELCTKLQSKIVSLLNLSGTDAESEVSVSSMKSAIDSMNQYMGSFSIIMGAVAGISLLVGGIGIMNMMLTNVTERIREIGIRRALGATRRDITSQFLAESAALCVSGGIIGIVIGYVLAWVLALLAANSSILESFGSTGSITPSFSIATVIFAFAVSVGIGVVFGYYPARRASRLDPVECLRYQ